MRSSRILYIVIESVALLLLVLIMTVLYYHQKSIIKKDFLKNRAYQITRTSEMLDSFMLNEKTVFEKFCSVPNRREAVNFLEGFADIYTLDSRLKVKDILRKAPDSTIKPGYDYSSNGLAPFFRSVDSSEIRNSGMFRTPENDNISVYIAAKKGNDIFAGRILLSKFLMNFAVYSGKREDIILFGSNEGDILASSVNSPIFKSLPQETDDIINLDKAYFITKKFNRSIDGMIILLTPVAAVFRPVEVTRIYLVYFFIIILAVTAGRLLLLVKIIIRPLENFIIMLTEWGLEKQPRPGHGLFSGIREFDILYNRFSEKTRQVRDSIIRLKDNKKELEEMRHYLKSLIDSMPSIIISVDMNARINEWNRAAEEFTGIAAGDAVDKPIWHIIPELGKYSDAFYEVLSRKELREFKKQLFTRNDEVYMDITIFPIIGVESIAAAIRIDDITMFEQAEKNLRQAQKMEIISTLTTGLAHDFNNVLGGILGAVSIMKKKINDRDDINDLRDCFTRYLGIIESSSERAEGIITRLLTLSMRQDVEFRIVDLNSIVKNVENICRNSFDKSVEIITLIPESIIAINADSNQIEQVMLNLCINAAHSMTIMKSREQAQGGKLTISLSEKISGARLYAEHAEANPCIEYTSFSVTDEGVGIESARLEKIFEPFYTTKSKVSGSGLGLSTANNIIRLHGGFITVVSSVDEGSEFTVYLPSVEMPESVQPAEPLKPAAPGEGIILVIDDEPVIRDLASDILVDCGYSVITAADGREAVDIFSGQCGSIRLVLLDLMMPGMSGLETFRELQKINSNVKVLMSSGLWQDERISKAASLGAAGFIHKPYTLEKLSEAVYRILGINSSV